MLEFKKGDLVRLKSGGPEMTVEEIGERAMIGGEAVWCAWFEYSGRRQVLKRETFPSDALEQSVGEAASTVGGIGRG